MFWAFAAATLFIAVLLTFLPLLRGKTLWQPVALALIFALPALGLWLYDGVGTPEAIGVQAASRTAADHTQQDGEIDAMIGGLRARLESAPDDLEGWILLARTLKTMQRFPEALEALQQAHAVAPDDPFVMVELAEARIFTSPDGRIDVASLSMLKRAVELDPAQQKGLWLLGIAAAQAGELDSAITYWESLLALLEPGSPVAQSVQTQIDEARGRQGMPASPPATAPAVAQTAPPGPAAGSEATTDEAVWQGTAVRVSASDTALAAIPPNAVLYVMVRPPGAAVGPPLGVRRVIDPALPLDLTISDGDSMMQERKISLESEIQLQARISLTGSPAARSGDWQSAPVTVPLAPGRSVELRIDQQVE
jgi:cytochrome c-type biogenesis protein CcmH